MRVDALLPAAALALIATLTGCYDEPVTAPLPPPPPSYVNQVPAIVQLAQRNGYRAGFDDGGRDFYYKAGYAPRRDERYRDAPGYDYHLGPIPVYVDAYRNAYLRGYDKGFYHLGGYEPPR